MAVFGIRTLFWSTPCRVYTQIMQLVADCLQMHVEPSLTLPCKVPKQPAVTVLVKAALTRALIANELFCLECEEEEDHREGGKRSWTSTPPTDQSGHPDIHVCQPSTCKTLTMCVLTHWQLAAAVTYRARGNPKLWYHNPGLVNLLRLNQDVQPHLHAHLPDAPLLRGSCS